jgi:class 3 adenylate cyclase
MSGAPIADAKGSRRSGPLRGGFAHGQALIMDGDDYIGRPTNLASRLCQAAHPEELLAVGYPAASLPTWVKVLGVRSVTLPGLGRIRGAQRLGLIPDLELPDLSRHPSASEPGQ